MIRYDVLQDPSLYDVDLEGVDDESYEGTDIVVFGGFLVGFAALLVLLSFYKKRLPKPSSADLRPLIENRELPFSVCSRCRIMIDLVHGFRCPQCNSFEHCVRVEQESERSIANAAVGPPPS